MRRIKFYSEYDLACGWELDKIIGKINSEIIKTDFGIADIIEDYNILRYIDVQRFSDYIIQNTNIDIKNYKDNLNQKIGRFVDENKYGYLRLYKNIEFHEAEDFFQIMDKYKIFQCIDEKKFQQFIKKEESSIHAVLRFQRIVNKFDVVIKDVLLSDARNTLTILGFYYGEGLFLPKCITELEINKLFNEYIALSKVDIGVLNQILYFPVNKGLKISDKTKLKAKRRAEKEKEKVFKNETEIKGMGVSISYPKNQNQVMIYAMEDEIADIKISMEWIKENLDFPTLWNNFIYLFSFTDEKMMLQLVSKKSELGVIESTIHQKAEHLYLKSTSFLFREILAQTMMASYIATLDSYGIKLEKMIEWFFIEYIKEEFQVNNFSIKMPSNKTTYFEKCRTILPEIDKIFKQYNMLVQEGEIEQELLQISSSSVKNKDIKSFSNKKYVYPQSEWYDIASYLLFSSQSIISFLFNEEKQYNNFYELITSVNIRESDFKESQLEKMQWLYDKGIICKETSGYIRLADSQLIRILRDLYYEEAISYWHYPERVRMVIDDLENGDLVVFEDTLLSRNEQDYFDYYLNMTKFTNGYEIRNKYLHGTNPNDEKQHKNDYYIILQLFIIIVIKINDELCIKDNYLDKQC